MRAQAARLVAWDCPHCGNAVPPSYAHKCLPFEHAIEDAPKTVRSLRWYADNWPKKKMLAKACIDAAALIESLIPASAMSGSAQDRETGLGPQGASAVPNGETPKGYLP